ncbi:MAG: ATP-binding protein [Nitrospirota bacterium]
MKRLRFIFVLFLISAFSLLVLFYLYQSLRSEPGRLNAEAEAFLLIKVVFWGGAGLIAATLIRFLFSRVQEEKRPEPQEGGLLVNTFQDVIHELKQKERALTKINEGTQAYLTEMKILQEQLEMKKRLVLMGEMSAFIAHEFRNYMGTILGFASMLSKEFQPTQSGAAMTAAIIRELSTMEQLITDLLSYGKNLFLTLTDTPITPLIEELLDAFGHDLDKNLRIEFVTVLEVCNANMDPTLMKQALSNLIRNGIEAMTSEEEIDSRILTVTAGYRTDRFLEIKVSNTGRGIPMDQQEKIFLPFFTTKEKGSGLGLALVQKIILAHNGTVSMESTKEKGTTFIITLPQS